MEHACALWQCTHTCTVELALAFITMQALEDQRTRSPRLRAAWIRRADSVRCLMLRSCSALVSAFLSCNAPSPRLPRT